jgi:hypothetical protein
MDPFDNARNHLGELLKALEATPRDHDTRLKAANLANRLCLDAGDGRLADVAEALAVDMPGPVPRAFKTEMARQASVARAARRAVALAGQRGYASPRSLANSLLEDPARIAEEVLHLRRHGREPLARALLEVALARFPDDALLHALEENVRQRSARMAGPTG